jgi:ribosomal protein S18 acetylase RimI-like enzyme
MRANGDARPRAKEAELYYIHVPTEARPVSEQIDFLPVTQFLDDEAACKLMWELISDSFRTRSKFLTIWPCVRYVAVSRRNQEVAGLLLVSTPLNWQIDYVLVRPSCRHQGIATALVSETINQALARKVPYVMLTSRQGLRPLYEGECGFAVVGGSGSKKGEAGYRSLSLCPAGSSHS